MKMVQGLEERRLAYVGITRARKRYGYIMQVQDLHMVNGLIACLRGF